MRRETPWAGVKQKVGHRLLPAPPRWFWGTSYRHSVFSVFRSFDWDAARSSALLPHAMVSQRDPGATPPFCGRAVAPERDFAEQPLVLPKQVNGSPPHTHSHTRKAARAEGAFRRGRCALELRNRANSFSQ